VTWQGGRAECRQRSFWHLRRCLCGLPASPAQQSSQLWERTTSAGSTPRSFVAVRDPTTVLAHAFSLRCSNPKQRALRNGNLTRASRTHVPAMPRCSPTQITAATTRRSMWVPQSERRSLHRTLLRSTSNHCLRSSPLSKLVGIPRVRLKRPLKALFSRTHAGSRLAPVIAWVGAAGTPAEPLSKINANAAYLV
jgi:hypothetical protein